MPRKVYCSGCIHLLLVKRQQILPLCLATAKFKGGTLRKNIDVVGLTLAEKRNARNNCRRRHVLFGYFRIKSMKDWLRRDIDAEEAKIGDYDEKEEIAQKKRLTKKHKEAAQTRAPRQVAESESDPVDEVRDFDSSDTDGVPDTEGFDGASADEEPGEGSGRARADSGDVERASNDETDGDGAADGASDSAASRESGSSPETDRGNQELRPSSQWMQLYDDKFTILDPDGWDRLNYEVSWEEPITRLEFLRRVMLSTCEWHVKTKAELDDIFKGVELPRIV